MNVKTPINDIDRKGWNDLSFMSSTFVNHFLVHVVDPINKKIIFVPLTGTPLISSTHIYI